MSKADDIIQEYKRLIRSIPRSNQYLLLYVLDLLSVFARKSDKNLMTASSERPLNMILQCLTPNTDLAVIFRPGILAHPDHDMVPSENDLSQRVVEFLIDHQDWFMLEVPPPPRSASSYSSTHPIYRGQSPTAKSTGTEDDLVIIPSSDEERNNATTSNPQSNGSNTLGGWRLIPRRKGRTQEPPNGKHLRKGSGDSRDSGSYPPVARPPGFDRSGTSTSSVERRNTYDVTESGALVSPTNATTDDVTLAKEATVTRSRTFPSKGSSPGTGTGASNGNGNSSSAEKQEQRASNVLKKKSRARPISTQVPQAAKDIATA
jgi:GTPase-activating protein SAC7